MRLRNFTCLTFVWVCQAYNSVYVLYRDVLREGIRKPDAVRARRPLRLLIVLSQVAAARTRYGRK